MRLSDYKDEDALDLLADLIEPTSKILADVRIANLLRENKRMKAIKIAIKDHKSEVMEILAALDGTPIEEYHCNILTIPMQLLDILNDEELVKFFTSQGQMMDESSSGSAMENIEEKEK